MWNRRDFLKNISLASLVLGTGLISKRSLAAKNQMQKITILHTNDLHSRIDPFPKEDPEFGGLGGFARINALVQKIRKTEDHVLLLMQEMCIRGLPILIFSKERRNSS